MSRASWNFTYEKGLVDILHDHKHPRFRANNGWVSEGWKSITLKFNERFPLAKFTKQQIQEKEKELKGNYKLIRDARGLSGTGWDDNLGMIKAELPLWDRIIARNSKMSKFKTKAFPLFNQLATLYEGSIATGDLNFTSAESLPPPSTSSDYIVNLEAPSNPFSASLDGQGTSSAHVEQNEVQSAPSSSNPSSSNPKKRKQSQVAEVLENYLDYKKEQAQKVVEKLDVSTNRDMEFSVGKCVAVLESIEGLTDEQKAKALGLFKCQLNREIFLNTTNTNIRLIWLKSEISS